MLTDKEKITNYETLMHIMKVRNYINIFVRELLIRGEEHDSTKMESPELEIFTEHTGQLAELTYGSDEYKAKLKELMPALEHHYANNAHHPEYADKNIQWKPIFGYEDHYEVSNLGDVRGVDRTSLRSGKTGDLFVHGKTRKYHITPHGYARMKLSKDGIQKNYLVHRIVAENFINNPLNLSEVNHIDGNKLNNNVKNLEWVTSSQNQLRAYQTGLKEPNVKYVVHCKELDITTFGINKMEELLRNKGYKRADASGIYTAMMNDGTHLDLTFEATRIEEYRRSQIDSMTLFDIIEMFCDWKAASKRHNNGDINKSIKINSERFGISDQLTRIFENTVSILED